jgi:hypothetical protein
MLQQGGQVPLVPSLHVQSRAPPLYAGKEQDTDIQDQPRGEVALRANLLQSHSEREKTGVGIWLPGTGHIMDCSGQSAWPWAEP